MSEDFLSGDVAANSTKTALVLINNNDKVSPGQWNMQLCIKDNFYMGSMLPQLDWAQSNDFPVLIMNPNKEIDPENKHAREVWEKYILNSGFKTVHIITNDNGALSLLDIQKHFIDKFYD